jgi:hypothetical protein
MKFLPALSVLFFALILLSCQSGTSVPEQEDFSKLKGLVSEIELQMSSLRAELEQITDYNESLLQKRDSILGTPVPSKYTMEMTGNPMNRYICQQHPEVQFRPCQGCEWGVAVPRINSVTQEVFYSCHTWSKTRCPGKPRR